MKAWPLEGETKSRLLSVSLMMVFVVMHVQENFYLVVKDLQKIGWVKCE